MVDLTSTMVTWFALVQTEFSNVRTDLQALASQGKVQSKGLDGKMKFIQYQLYISSAIIVIFGVSYLLLEISLLLTLYCTL